MNEFDWIKDVEPNIELECSTPYMIDCTNTSYDEETLRTKLCKLVGFDWMRPGHNSMYVNWFNNGNITRMGNSVVLIFKFNRESPYVRCGWTSYASYDKYTNTHKEITLNEFLNSEYVNSNFTVV